AGGRPPLGGRLARGGDHRGQQHQQAGGEPGAGQRGADPGQRVRDQHRVGESGGRGGDRLGVIVQTGGFVLAGQVDGDGAVPAPAQLGFEQVPVPGGAPAAVDQYVVGHRPHPRRREGGRETTGPGHWIYLDVQLYGRGGTGPRCREVWCESSTVPPL